MSDTIPPVLRAWPQRMRTDEAAEYLREMHGLPLEGKTLRNWRASGRRGPTCKYLGALPLYERRELDRWSGEDALQDECPTARTRRIARETSPEPAA
jgi:hypothetical protein